MCLGIFSAIIVSNGRTNTVATTMNDPIIPNKFGIVLKMSTCETYAMTISNTPIKLTYTGLIYLRDRLMETKAINPKSATNSNAIQIVPERLKMFFENIL